MVAELYVKIEYQVRDCRGKTREPELPDIARHDRLGARKSKRLGIHSLHAQLQLCNMLLTQSLQISLLDMMVRQAGSSSPRGGKGGAKPGSRVQRFWGPLEAIQGASERCVRFQRRGSPFSKEREKKVGHSEAPERRFPGCPLRGFQPSGSYPLRPQIKFETFQEIFDFHFSLGSGRSQPLVHLRWRLKIASDQRSQLITDTSIARTLTERAALMTHTPLIKVVAFHLLN